MKATLKPKHANPISNFAQRLTEILNDDELDLIFKINLQKP
jgi:hypothetical protein